MSDDPIDLSALRRPSDAAIEDRVVAAVRRQLALREPMAPGLALALWAWARPALIAAGLIVAVAGGVLLGAPGGRWAAPTTTWESVGVPRAVARWAATGELEPRALLDELAGGGGR